jgi:tetratricopeptide (TPR) repeat protein
MPSLNALGEFKYSFGNIANEKDDVISQEMPYDDLPLPTKEAPPFEFSRQALSPDASGATEPDSGAVDFDFSALLNSLPGEDTPSIDNVLDMTPGPPDLSLPDDDSAATGIIEDSSPSVDDTSLLNDIPSGDSQEPESVEAPASTGEDDFSVPNGLLSGLSEEIESAPPDLDIKDINGGFETEDAQSGDFGLDGLAGTGDEGAQSGDSDIVSDKDFAVGGEDAESQSLESQDSGDLPDFNFPADESPNNEAAAESGAESGIDGGLAEDFDLGGETAPAAGTESADDAFDLGGDVPFAGAEADEGTLPNIDFPVADDAPATDDAGLDASADAGMDSPLSEMDFPAMDEPAPEAEASADAGAEASPGAEDGGSIDFGDLGSDFSSESIELSSEPEPQGESDIDDGGYSAGDIGGEDFALPGLEDIFDKSKVQKTTQPAPKKGLFSRKKTKEEDLPEAEGDIEEISLTREDVDRLLRTLASYPLNLRIACEEIIAEQVILPQQLSRLIRLLVSGAYVRDTADHVEKITGKPVVIPKSFEKMTGAAFEAEQSSFAYIFVHNFLPVLRLFAVIAALAASVIYLGYKFVYIPLRAESLYKRGYERIPAGEYQRANELFHDAFVLHRKKNWFYLYAEAFREERRYMLAEAKYDELLRYYPRDKKGVLDYANLETYYLLNYEKANRLLQRELLDYAPNDYDGLLAAGDNFLAWADSDPSKFYDKYEDARFSYARLLETYGWQAPVVERMMKYFIRIDNLREVLYLRVWFENQRKSMLSAESLSELGGYLLDKQLEKPQGVPNPYVESIESVRDMLLEAIKKEPTLPEPHYHLARYHHNLGNAYEERLTLENAIRAFNLARTESVRRRLYRVDTHYRYANLLIENKEFFPAEEQVVRGIELYEDFLSRNLISASPQLGQLYAVKGDLEYFVKTGNMGAALTNYRLAERYGHAPPEIQYRMGCAYYQLEDWRNALEYLFKASSQLPLNRRLLYALGNAAYKRGDYYAAQGYYTRLLDILESQRVRLPVLLPNDNPQFLELGERLMMARNNIAVVYEALAEQTGNREYRSRALALYADSSRAWDAITRNPDTMVRMRLADSPGVPGINLGYLNASNALRPSRDYRPEIFIRIDRDVLEPSRWEELAPFGSLVY